MALSDQLIKKRPLNEVVEEFHSFVYQTAAQVLGTMEEQGKRPRRARTQPRPPAADEELRERKRELRRLFRRAERDSDPTVDQLRREWRKVMRLHNKLRLGHQRWIKSNDTMRERQRFRKDPYQFAKNLLNPPSPTAGPQFSKEQAYAYFTSTYNDPQRDLRFELPPQLAPFRPPEPAVPFDLTPPALAQFRSVLNKKKNGAAPGPDGVPYVVYKRCRFLAEKLHLIVLRAWSDPEMPRAWQIARLIAIPKPTTVDTTNPAEFRPIAIGSTAGKVFTSLMSVKLVDYMVRNKFIDVTIQKGFIPKTPGCLHHEELLMAALRDAQLHKKPICIAFLDVFNAYGSVKHNLINFALWYYRVPLQFRLKIFTYYKFLVAFVSLMGWVTDPIHFGVGVFQGCPLSVILFLVVFNLLVVWTQLSDVQGYTLSDKVITLLKLLYADDTTAITRTPTECQTLLNLLVEFAAWAHLKWKPSKCVAFARKLHVQYSGSKGHRRTKSKHYKTFDPELHLGGERIGFIGHQLFKFLGRKISASLSDAQVRDEVEKALTEWLEKVDASLITGPMKMWVYNFAILAKLTWVFTVYDFPISFVEQLDSLVIRFLKKWSRLTKCAAPELLFLQRDISGIRLSLPSTIFKQRQVGKMLALKTAHDHRIRDLYQHLARLEADNKQLAFKPTAALGDAERAVHFEEIRGPLPQGKQGLGFGSKAPSAYQQKVSDFIRHTDEDAFRRHMYTLAMQGAWTSWDHFMKFDLTWNRLLYHLPEDLYSFWLKSTSNTLPTPDNLRRWGYVAEDHCSLCGKTPAAITHVLAGCKVALNQGRFDFRHDSVLNVLLKHLTSAVDKHNSQPVRLGPPVPVKFVKEEEGSKSRRGSAKTSNSILHPATDWVIQAEKVNGQGPMFPLEIAVTTQRPDIVIYSRKTKRVLILELTSPMEQNFATRHDFKVKKYEELLAKCRDNGWRPEFMAFEVGARGFLAKSTSVLLSSFNLSSADIRFELGSTALRCSYAIFIQRRRAIWQQPVF